MGPRRKARELALQFLYGHDLQGHSNAAAEVTEELQCFKQTFETDEKALDYGHCIITGLCAHRAEIDQLLTANSHNWRLERMSLVDRNILRIAIFEMQFDTGVPPQVAINEALEIAKRYSVADSVGFINGILDSIQTSIKQT